MTLENKTVLVTRSPNQASALEDLLRARGADIVSIAALEIAPPDSFDELDAALGGRFDLVVVGSKNALDSLLDRAARLKIDLGSRLFAAVGEKTAAAITEALGGEPIVGATFRAESLVEALESRFGAELSKMRVLFPRAEEGRETLISLLEELGADVVAPTAYQIVPARAPSAAALARLHEVDVATFLSGKTLEYFLRLVPNAEQFLEGATVAVIGPVALAAAEKLGVRVDIVPPKATIEVLVEALDEHFRAR